MSVCPPVGDSATARWHWRSPVFVLLGTLWNSVFVFQESFEHSVSAYERMYHACSYNPGMLARYLFIESVIHYLVVLPRRCLLNFCHRIDLMQCFVIFEQLFTSEPMSYVQSWITRFEVIVVFHLVRSKFSSARYWHSSFCSRDAGPNPRAYQILLLAMICIDYGIADGNHCFWTSLLRRGRTSISYWATIASFECYCCLQSSLRSDFDWDWHSLGSRCQHMSKRHDWIHSRNFSSITFQD